MAAVIIPVLTVLGGGWAGAGGGGGGGGGGAGGVAGKRRAGLRNTAEIMAIGPWDKTCYVSGNAA